MLLGIARELLALYTDHTEPDHRLTSLTGSVEALQGRQVYQYCLESAWYLLQGLVAAGTAWCADCM